MELAAITPIKMPSWSEINSFHSTGVTVTTTASDRPVHDLPDTLDTIVILDTDQNFAYILVTKSLFRGQQPVVYKLPTKYKIYRTLRPFIEDGLMKSQRKIYYKNFLKYENTLLKNKQKEAEELEIYRDALYQFYGPSYMPPINYENVLNWILKVISASKK